MKLYTGNMQDSVTDVHGEATDARALLDSQLAALRDRLREDRLAGPERARVLLETGRTLLRLEHKEEAWSLPGRPSTCSSSPRIGKAPSRPARPCS